MEELIMKWYEKANFYQMYPIGMCGVPKYNNYGETTYRLQELEGWTDHLKSIGMNAVYIGPLFESDSHGYDTTDYKLIDRRLGDNQSFINMVHKYHEAGIKVVVDGVFNHTGRNFFAFKDIQQNGSHSRYKDWYRGINFNSKSPYNDNFSYEGWNGCYELVKLNLQNHEVKNYLLDVIQYWVDTFNIDGIRLDCADVLDFEFMKQMRTLSNQISDDFWLMGEVIHGDYVQWANDSMLHSVTNYEMHKGLYSSHNDYNYFEIAHSAKRQFNTVDGVYKNCCLYNFVDNHDVDRLASKLINQNHIYNVHTLLYTLPGIPSIYYGSEWGITGKKEGPNDDFLRPTVNINNVRMENPELMRYIRALSDVRNLHKALVSGNYQELFVANKQYAYTRFTCDNTVIVALNADNSPQLINIPLQTLNKSFSNLKHIFGQGSNWSINYNQLQVTIPACQSIIFELN
jgi:glycosidase